MAQLFVLSTPLWEHHSSISNRKYLQPGLYNPPIYPVISICCNTGLSFSLFFPHLNVHLSLVDSTAQFCIKCLQFLTLQYGTALTVSFICLYLLRWAVYLQYTFLTLRKRASSSLRCNLHYIYPPVNY